MPTYILNLFPLPHSPKDQNPSPHSHSPTCRVKTSCRLMHTLLRLCFHVHVHIRLVGKRASLLKAVERQAPSTGETEQGGVGRYLFPLGDAFCAMWVHLRSNPPAALLRRNVSATCSHDRPPPPAAICGLPPRAGRPSVPSSSRLGRRGVGLGSPDPTTTPRPASIPLLTVS